MYLTGERGRDSAALGRWPERGQGRLLVTEAPEQRGCLAPLPERFRRVEPVAQSVAARAVPARRRGRAGRPEPRLGPADGRPEGREPGRRQAIPAWRGRSILVRSSRFHVPDSLVPPGDPASLALN